MSGELESLSKEAFPSEEGVRKGIVGNRQRGTGSCSQLRNKTRALGLL